MKPEAQAEAQRWLIQAKDEFQDADELRLRGRFCVQRGKYLWVNARHS